MQDQTAKLQISLHLRSEAPSTKEKVDSILKNPNPKRKFSQKEQINKIIHNAQVVDMHGQLNVYHNITNSMQRKMI